MGSLGPSKVVIPHAAAVGRLAGREIVVSTLPEIVPVLISLGASQVVVPAPTAIDQRRVNNALAKMDGATRRFVRVVDKYGTIQRRIHSFVAPLVGQAKKWPEDAFASFSESEAYMFAVAAHHKAATLDRGGEGRIAEFLPILNPSVYDEEAKFRLSALAALGTSYEPTLIDNPHLRVSLSHSGARSLLERALDSVEFAEVVGSYGRLGYFTRPRRVLRQIARAVGGLVRTPEFRGTLKAALLTSHLAGPAGLASAAASASLDRAAKVLGGPPEYSPPMLGLDLSVEVQIAESALKRVGSAARFQRGYMFAETYSSGPVHGVSWLQRGEERKLVNNPKQWLRGQLKLLAKARASVPRLLAGN